MSTGDSPAPNLDTVSLADQLSNSSNTYDLYNVNDELNAMLQIDAGLDTAFDVEIGSFLEYEEVTISPTPLEQSFNVSSSMIKFRNKIDQHIAMIDAYYSESSRVLQNCLQNRKDGGTDQDAENPAALLLTCSKELTDIIQSLTPAAQLHTQTQDVLSTEIVLMALSSYLALMRLFDFLFRRIYEHISKVSPEACKSVKVKSVLRIGGISSLQDMSLKAYAISILDAIQAQVQMLERCMGIPTEYRIWGATPASPTVTAPGIFSFAHRQRLFRAAMVQEDLKPQENGKSYLESIRASMKDSIAFLDGIN